MFNIPYIDISLEIEPANMLLIKIPAGKSFEEINSIGIKQLNAKVLPIVYGMNPYVNLFIFIKENIDALTI